jgi:integrase
LLVHIGDPSSNQATTLESQMIHMIQELFGQTLRHTFASVAVASGVGLYLTGKILGHLRNSTTERYAHLADDPVREANDLVGARIEDAMRPPGGKTISTSRQSK